MLGKILHALLRRRAGASRWPYIFTALPAFLLVGHAYEYNLWSSFRIHLGIIAISLITMFRPTVLGWLILFVVFFTYGTLVLFSIRSGPDVEGTIFVLLGYVPAALLYYFRPSKSGGFLRA